MLPTPLAVPGSATGACRWRGLSFRLAQQEREPSPARSRICSEPNLPSTRGAGIWTPTALALGKTCRGKLVGTCVSYPVSTTESVRVLSVVLIIPGYDYLWDVPHRRRAAINDCGLRSVKVLFGSPQGFGVQRRLLGGGLSRAAYYRETRLVVCINCTSRATV